MTTQFKNGREAAVPGLSVILAACALVATGHLLGASWLSEPVLGLPAGLWLIGLIGIASSDARRRIADAVEGLAAIAGLASPGRREGSCAGAGALAGWWPRGPIGGAIVDGTTRAAAAAAGAALAPVWGGEITWLGECRRRLEARVARLPWPTRPLRIGLHLPDEEAEALVQTSGSCPVEWFRIRDWVDPQAVCRRHRFDAAVFHDGEGPLRIVTLERPGHAAGVVEWADLQGELTFASLFPVRVDPAAVVVEGATRTRVREGADLLRGLLDAAATLARSSHRLTLPDRLLGRRPVDERGEAAPFTTWRSRRPAAAIAFDRLAEMAAAQAEAWPEAAAMAARVAGAYFIASPGLEPVDRVGGLSAVMAASTGDAINALRLGAACIGALDDEAGLAWLVRADAAIRRGDVALAPLDHAAFLESELCHGTEDPMSVGRAAAGICMVCAATPAERVPFVRDDMLEEMAYAGWLVGRDQDRGLLISVFLAIEHATAAPAAGATAPMLQRTAAA